MNMYHNNLNKQHYMINSYVVNLNMNMLRNNNFINNNKFLVHIIGLILYCRLNVVTF